MYPREKGKKMEIKNGEWRGTVAELHEWLNQFNDDDQIVFIGGSDSGWEFMEVKINDKIVIETD